MRVITAWTCYVMYTVTHNFDFHGTSCSISASAGRGMFSKKFSKNSLSSSSKTFDLRRSPNIILLFCSSCKHIIRLYMYYVLTCRNSSHQLACSNSGIPASTKKAGQRWANSNMTFPRRIAVRPTFLAGWDQNLCCAHEAFMDPRLSIEENLNCLSRDGEPWRQVFPSPSSDLEKVKWVNVDTFSWKCNFLVVWKLLNGDNSNNNWLYEKIWKSFFNYPHYQLHQYSWTKSGYISFFELLPIRQAEIFICLPMIFFSVAQKINNCFNHNE